MAAPLASQARPKAHQLDSLWPAIGFRSSLWCRAAILYLLQCYVAGAHTSCTCALRSSAVEFKEFQFFGNVLYDLVSQPFQDLTTNISHSMSREGSFYRLDEGATS